MKSHGHDDPLIAALAGLPQVTPDAGHAERVRARCRASLETPAAPLAIVLEPAAVGGFCALYAWHIARIVLKFGTP